MNDESFFESINKLEQEYNGIKAQADSLISSSPETEESAAVKRFVDEIKPLLEYKELLSFHRLIKKIDESEYSVIYSRLKDLDTLMDLNDILKNLDIKPDAYKSSVDRDPIGFLVYYRQKFETKAEYLYDGLKDLESENRIGAYGQRIPSLFAKVRQRHPIESLPDSVVALLNSESDIEKLIATTVQVMFIYQAAHDLGFYIDTAIINKRKQIIDEIRKLEMDKDKLLADIEGLKQQTTHLQETNNALHKENTELYGILNSTQKKEDKTEDRSLKDTPLKENNNKKEDISEDYEDESEDDDSDEEDEQEETEEPQKPEKKEENVEQEGVKSKKSDNNRKFPDFDELSKKFMGE